MLRASEETIKMIVVDPRVQRGKIMVDSRIRGAPEIWLELTHGEWVVNVNYPAWNPVLRSSY